MGTTGGGVSAMVRVAVASAFGAATLAAVP